MAFGSGFGRDGAVGVGSGLIEERGAALEAAVAHELGHLRHGDPARIWRTRQWIGTAWRMAKGGVLPGLAVAAIAGSWLIAALTIVGVLSPLISRVFSNAMSRAMEARADRFAAALVGERAYADFFARMRAQGSAELSPSH